ncbi:MAG: hypothetical protein WKF59_19800 [Chitinophagaceae bacterium]
MKKKDPVAADYVSLGICRQLSRASDYAEGLKGLLQLLPRFTKRNDAYGSMISYAGIYSIYIMRQKKKKKLFTMPGKPKI